MPLSITRRLHERLFIGDDVEILVTRVSDGQVRLAIKAPKDMLIVREELAERLREKRKAATK